MAMIPNSRMLIPPSTGVGIPVITVFTGAKKEITMAMQAARKTTDTERDLGQSHDPDVLTVGGNGSTAEEGGDHRGHPISKQGAVETRS